MRPTTLLLPLLPLLASAAPTLAPAAESNTQVTAQQIQQIAPKSVNCDNPPAKGECATADQAAPNIAKSFETYGVTSRAEQAAVIALMAFESEEFRYSRNHFPGTVGKGTRNMQSPSYNAKYAESIPAISDKVSAANGDAGQILDILLADEEYDFGSGAWFLTTQCDQGVRQALQSGSEEGWSGYISGCVGTDANEGRKGYWESAVKALGV
ncbi:hypothetical protein SI65_03465 [Aspergillus cristatus]|uniref:Transglycosylase SLT domain-containing protein n=1 Tax=Aspergillus cristatus TaxID=573508 RepID=A0A1E3BHG6_ASPCR|nr:hypothetical protein SI65_03465 [Aspergillus cristatus]